MDHPGGGRGLPAGPEHQAGPRQEATTFLATAAREQIDIDVADFSNDGGVRHGLVAIDDFSKKLCVVPLESRRGGDMVQALDVVTQTLAHLVRRGSS